LTYLIGMTYIKKFKNIDEGRKINHPVIAIAGTSGSGKDMHANLLKKRLEKDFKLNLPIYQSGEKFREEAEKRGITIEQFGALLKKDQKLSDEVDKKVDKNMLEMAMKKPGIYVGRLTTYIIGDNGYKIFLYADIDLVAERISKDPTRDECKRGLTKEQIKAEKIKRDKDNNDRYKRLYGIIYDKDIRTTADIVVKNDRAPEVVFEDFYRPLVKWMKEKGYLK
jgi:cytidylate kinase